MIKQFSLLIDRTLTSVTTLGQSGPGGNGNEGVQYIAHISRSGAAPKDSV